MKKAEPGALMFPKVVPRGRVDKSKLVVATAWRVRNEPHLKSLRKCRCSVPGCTRGDIQAHHLTCGPEPKARGMKASDCFAVPLCRVHHDPNSRESIHHAGDERAWWDALGLDPDAIAATHWQASVKAGRVKSDKVAA